MRNTGHRCLCLIIPSILTPVYLFIFLHYLTIPIAGYTYTPTENFAINCGSAENWQALARNWTGDVDSKFSPSEKGELSTTSLAAEQPFESFPYSTARLSRNEFTYSFPLTAGQKYIRLHFYPSSYGEFDRSKAFFSVKTGGGYTLLSNFSAALAAEDIQKETIVREFCINFNEEGEKLNITFTPTAGADAYAFINGIEIVSMPDNLYYTAQDGGFQFIGQQNSFFVETDHALENVYRLNVGGKSLSPTDDTGMFRTWDADDEYCVKLAFVPANTSINLKFTQIPNYTAPLDVYRTARTMGNNKTENMGYNLTWFLPVDSGFSYLLRLHFCEFQPEIQEQHDREFAIIIANQTAENHADVITWSTGNGVPIYKDYGVMMPSQGSNKKQNLYIQLHPNPDSETVYNDAILNGIELFKLSNPEKSLAGPNPDPSEAPAPPPPVQSTSPKRNKTKLIAIAGSVVAGLIALSVIVLFIVWRGRRVRDSEPSDGGSWWGQFSYTSVKSTKTSRSSLPSDLCRHFTLQEVKVATNNFDQVFIIGVGGFGNVYKGYINGGTTPVAIKRLNPESQQGAQEFQTEIEMLSQLRHLHLVSLIGYCNDDREMILVYDYMAHGTLRDHLYKTDNPPLSWKQRLEICIGAARGLHYLHTGVKHTIIHRDVKTTNILLDEKWVAKVSDFGLSKMGPTSMSNAHVSTVVKGSFGYLDPEYYRRQQLTEKSDVYSFGVVLFEVLCARPPLNQTVEKERVSLAQWAPACYRDGKLEQIVDPFLKGKIAPDCLQKFGEIAVSCLQDQGIERPSMSDVVWGLQFAMQLQESAEQEMEKSGSWRKVKDEEAPLKASITDDSDDAYVLTSDSGGTWDSKSSGVMIQSSGEEKSSTSCESDALMSGAVFSEILNPKGR
ncbi:receptor-like protein kinase FERONIA [Vitis vinifera]|uniref:receptor-like protein kinase FERONIA n=1 Tax=Vitis vinifera TaxID=29760 RepID=UPI00015C8CFC|nr:receptor-like protein kinase FERONIA [Vitis vinifera]